jgi:hypothetical protein
MDLSILDTGFHDLLRYEGYADYAKEAGRKVPPREVCMLSHYTFVLSPYSYFRGLRFFSFLLPLAYRGPYSPPSCCQEAIGFNGFVIQHITTSLGDHFTPRRLYSKD